MAFELPKLKYSYDSLEPHIDSKTMEIHYSKHHNGYTNNLNNALSGTNKESETIENILNSLDLNNSALRNNAGGYYNHCLFWEILSPNSEGKPLNKTSKLINDSFGSFENFKDQFSKAASARYGSGWAWLCVHDGGKLEVCSSANQDNPLMPGSGRCGTPILGLDVWEHAYYLNYQNRRPDYIEAFFNVINWGQVQTEYDVNK